MFSTITIASSTTKPVAIVSAISVRLLTEKPARYITPKVPTSDKGTTTLGMMVAGMLRRNRNVTITTRAMAKINSCCTSRTDDRMVSVRLLMTTTSIVEGRVAVSCGSSRSMRSTTSMTLAPGWRWMLTSTAGISLAHAERRRFSAPSTTSATSDRRSGAPSRYAMMRLR